MFRLRAKAGVTDKDYYLFREYSFIRSLCLGQSYTAWIDSEEEERRGFVKDREV